jgi:hypothetical protein
LIPKRLKNRGKLFWTLMVVAFWVLDVVAGMAILYFGLRFITQNLIL